MVIGRLGQVCADAGADATTNAAASQRQFLRPRGDARLATITLCPFTSRSTRRSFPFATGAWQQFAPPPARMRQLRAGRACRRMTANDFPGVARSASQRPVCADASRRSGEEPAATYRRDRHGSDVLRLLQPKTRSFCNPQSSRSSSFWPPWTLSARACARRPIGDRMTSAATIIQPTNVEVHFDTADIIVSKTNLKGKITYANTAFCTVSGYSLPELIGAPHSLIRHPDMPRAVFKLLWDTI